jgi:hypothetical protein
MSDDERSPEPGTIEIESPGLPPEAPVPEEITPYASPPKALGGFTIEITGLAAGEEASRVYVHVENTNDYPIQCAYTADVVIDGQQYQEGFSSLGEVQAKATLDSYYEWDSRLPEGEELSLHGYCFDEHLPNDLKQLSFDLVATKQ